MKFLLLLVVVMYMGFAMAAPSNPCSTTNGKTYCTGFIPGPEPEKLKPCSTVDGKTFCTGLILPPGGPGTQTRRRRSPIFVNAPQQ